MTSTFLCVRVCVCVCAFPPQINPSGVNVDEKPNIITEWLKLLSPIKWAIESLVVAEFRDMDFDDKDRGIWCVIYLSCFQCIALLSHEDHFFKSL